MHVETLEHRAARHQWKIDPHVHCTLHQMIFILRGSGIAHMEGRLAEFRTPALMVIPATTVHGFVYERNTQGFVLSLTDDVLRDIVQREPGIGTLFENPATVEFRYDCLLRTDLKQSFLMFAREFERAAAGHTLALECLLGLILANVLRLSRALAQTGRGTGRHRHLVARFRQLVESDFRGNKSVAAYARALNVSESRLRSACLAVTDQSPMQLVHTRLLLQAKRELTYTTASISEIAYALGFDDPAYFTRFFSHRIGASPRAFRARLPRTWPAAAPPRSAAIAVE